MYKASLISLLCYLHHPATTIITQISKHKLKQTILNTLLTETSPNYHQPHNGIPRPQD